MYTKEQEEAALKEYARLGRIIMAVQQRALKKPTINVMRPVIQDIHQPNSNMRYYAVALNSVRM